MIALARFHSALTPTPPLGYVQTIKNEGMPIFEKEGHGDLYVQYNVVLPSSLTSSVRKSKGISFIRSRALLIDSFVSELTEAFRERSSSYKEEL